METMFSSHPLRNEDLNGLIQKLSAFVPKELFRLRVHQNDAALLIGDNDGVGSRLNKLSIYNFTVGERLAGHGALSASGTFIWRSAKKEGELREDPALQS